MTRRRRRGRGSDAGLLLVSLAGGAVAASLLQPRAGARRRGLVVQKAIHAGKVVEQLGERSARELANRSRGIAASARARVRSPAAPPEVLCERVRSRLGRLTFHPGAIEVSAAGGTVELRGPVLRSEADQVVAGVRRVRGVREVVDLLERHDEPGTVPGLQGGPRRPPPVSRLVYERWEPASRLLAIALGAALVALGLRARGNVALVLGGAGTLLALRGASNVPLRRLAGVAGRERPSLLARGAGAPGRSRAG